MIDVISPVVLSLEEYEGNIIVQFNLGEGTLTPDKILRDALVNTCKNNRSPDLVRAIISDPRFKISKSEAIMILRLASAWNDKIHEILLADERFCRMIQVD